jgi:hypothetical protein
MFQAKLVISGPILEVYKYDLPHRSHEGPSAFSEKWKEEFPEPKESPEKIALNSFYRSKKEAKRIMFSNAWKWFKENGRPYPPFFLTLTFEDNIQDLNLANDFFRKFIQRFNYKLGYKKAHLQYLGIREFQKRGAIHYHLIIFNLPYIKDRVYRTIFNLWGQGRFELKMVKTMSGLVGYLSKYMVKEAEDGRLLAKKRYFTSKSIKRPIVIRDTYAVLTIASKLKDRLDFEKEFETKFVGTMKYEKYILKDDDDILNLDLDQSAMEAISLIIKE